MTGLRHSASRILRIATRIVRSGTTVNGRKRARVAGFTLLEMMFAVEVMMLLTLISFNETRRVGEHAKVAACMRYHGIVQRSLWADYALDGEFPNSIAPTLGKLPKGALDQVYSYVPIGGGPGGGATEYYLRCGHNHSYVGVLFCDSGAYFTGKPIYALAAARGAI